MRNTVFLDPTGHRARFINWIATVAALVGLLTIAVVFIGTVEPPRALEVPEQPDTNYGSPGILQPSIGQKVPLSPGANRVVIQDTLKALRLAFFSLDDFSSFQSLRQHSRELDGIIPDWLHLVQSGGKVDVAVDPHSQPIIAWLRNSAPTLSVYPSLSTELSTPEISGMLANSSERSAVVKSLTSLLAANAWSGVVVDFDAVQSNAHFEFARFLAELRSALGAKKVIVVAQGYYEDGQPLQEISRIVDYVLVPSYDLPGENRRAVGTAGRIREADWRNGTFHPCGETHHWNRCVRLFNGRVRRSSADIRPRSMGFGS